MKFLTTRTAAFAALLSIVAWSFRPVPLEEIAIGEDSFSVGFLVGKSSHLPPAVRVINWALHPIRRQLVPLDALDMKGLALKLVYGDDNVPVVSDDDEVDLLFGDLASWDAYEKYVEVADDSLHLLGRFLAKNIIVGYLAQHVYMTKRLRENPEIKDEVIAPPIFLASYTRSGGTFIYQVLSDIFNEEITPVRHFEILGGAFEIPHAPLNQREEADIGLKTTKFLNPPLSLMHEYTTTDDPEEDAGWYAYSFTGLASSFIIPSRYHLHLWLDQTHQVKWHDLLETILKIKQFDDESRRGCRAILKSPEHLIAMNNAVAKFPEASVIVIDREETPWYKSALVMTHQVAHLMKDPKVEESLHFSDIVICAQRRARDLALLTSKDEIDILHFKFSHLFNQTYDYAEQFAHFVGLNWDQDKQEHAKRVISERLSWKKSKLRYKIEDFGITEDDIRSRLTKCDEIMEVDK